MPVCTEPGCPELVPTYGYCPGHRRDRNRVRNADPRRRARYGRGWEADRQAALAAQPWCGFELEDGGICGAVEDLTVDHDPSGGRNVWCRRHHSMMEARRRAALRASR